MVASVDLEPDANRSVTFDQEDAVTKNPVDEVRRSVVQNHQIERATDGLLQIHLKPETHRREVGCY